MAEMNSGIINTDQCRIQMCTSRIETNSSVIKTNSTVLRRTQVQFRGFYDKPPQSLNVQVSMRVVPYWPCSGPDTRT